MESFAFTVFLVVVVVAFNLFQRSSSADPSKRKSTRRSTRRKAAGTRKASKRTFNQTPPQSGVLTGHAHVIDGDTIVVQNTKIRLAGIDAPEIDMPWGQKSKWAMVDICKGQTIRIELNGETSFDRLVGVGYLPNGADIGAELIKRGLALDLTHFSKGKYLQFEPEGARKRLANGRFGYSKVTYFRSRQNLTVTKIK